MFVVIGCSSPEVSNTIFIQISPKSLIVENKTVDKNKFASELKNLVKTKLKAGLKKDAITINVKVDPQTSRGEIVDLETDMRILDLKTVIYSSHENDKEVVLRLE